MNNLFIISPFKSYIKYDDLNILRANYIFDKLAVRYNFVIVQENT